MGWETINGGRILADKKFNPNKNGLLYFISVPPPPTPGDNLPLNN